MTKAEIEALVTSIGEEKVLCVKFNNNIVEYFYGGTFKLAENIQDINGFECFVSSHSIPSKCTKYTVSGKEYKPLFTVEGIEFVDDKSMFQHIDRWVTEQR